MRLSTSQTHGTEQQQFDLAETLADLGFHTRMGYQISAIPDPAYPWDPAIVKKIRREFDPAWTPLFARERWMTPNKGFVTTERHMVGRWVPVPKTDVDMLKVLTPLRSTVRGIKFRTPLLEAMTLEVRLHEPDCPCESCVMERDSNGMVRRDLGRYVPFDERVYLTCKAIWHQNHSMRAKDLAREIAYLQVDKPQEESAKQMEELRYVLKTDWAYLERLRERETEDDVRRDFAPKEVAPMVLVGKSAGSTPAIGAA